jgi:hypothetical protein
MLEGLLVNVGHTTKKISLEALHPLVGNFITLRVESFPECLTLTHNES